jgi:hypothetical protein
VSGRVRALPFQPTGNGNGRHVTSPPRSPVSHALALGTAVVLMASLLSAFAGPSSAVSPTERRAERSFVVWDSTAISPTLGKIRAHGKVPGGKRKVFLQVEVKRSWQTFGRTVSDGKGRFRIAGRLDWYGRHEVRVVAPGRRGFVSAKRVGVSPAYVPIGSRKSFDFIHGSSVRDNYRFNPCQRISYRVNAQDVGPTGRALVKQALTQVTWATGIEFRYVGKSKAIPYNMARRKHYPRGTDLVIAWATHAEVPDFVRRSAAGFGGPRWVYAARNSKGQRVMMTTEAGVTLSTDYWTNGFAHSFLDNTRPTMGELILHEVGHAVGLDHVPTAAEQIMNGRGYYRYPDGYYKGLYNKGDLNGLSQVGLKQGCLRQIGRGRATEVAVDMPPLP